MTKLDLTKKYKKYYKASKHPETATIDKVRFISILGKGDPSGIEFTNNIQALYTVAYTIKFYYKEKDQDFVVSKLEGLWWYDVKRYPDLTMLESNSLVPRNEWEYRIMIRMPDFVDQQVIQNCINKAFEKNGNTNIKKIASFEMEEGLCVQIMHIGPYSDEIKSLIKMKAFMDKNKLGYNGLHHEIYLSDFRRTAPEKLKTILREPVMLKENYF